MPTSLTYRTADSTRWGGGNGSDLSATQIDLNFWTLYAAIAALEADGATGVGIDFITQAGGNLLYVTLTNHAVLGPFTIPTAQWNPRGAWTPTTAYAAFDVVSNDGSLYLGPVAHTSGATFSALSTDGFGHLLYVLILSSPQSVLPLGGTSGQRLVNLGESPLGTAWESDLIRLALFIEGQPLPGETLMQYAVADDMTLPGNLAGTVVYQGTPTASTVQYTVNKNGAAIGTITFNGPSPETVVVSSAQVNFVPGDILTIVGPSVPDTAQANISITLVAELTL